MIKDIIVHLDGTPRDEDRLRHAQSIAVAMQAHVTGLFTNPLPDLAALVPMDGAAVAAAAVVNLEDDAKRSGDALEATLNARLARLAVPSALRRIDATPGALPARAAVEARTADLMVFGRPYADDGAALWDSLFETVLFEAGRGVLVVPPLREPSEAIRRVLVCWRDTRESARAVAEAAPLIAQAPRTMVLTIDEGRRETGTGAEAADIARHLTRLGSQVEVRHVQSKDASVCETILDQARRMSADLVVMGGYGHSRAREWLLGGATRDMLNASDVPILMAH